MSWTMSLPGENTCDSVVDILRKRYPVTVRTEAPLDSTGTKMRS